MKVLVYGIDGADIDVFNIFIEQMPFFKKFFEENTEVQLQEDLINRGWVEMLTGKYGKDTRGFYMSPVLDGSHTFATSYKLSELANDPKITALWDLSEAKKKNYCIMNVPTTTPVPTTGTLGVVIGSAGGGLNKIEGIPKVLVSDEETRNWLEENNYIVDIRIPNSEIASTEDLFERLSEKELRRKDCFIGICEKRKAEFGFLANRGNTIVEYLCRREIENYKKGEKSWVTEYLEKHFRELDAILEELYTRLKPEHFIITADHGIKPSRHWANVNPFLEENKWLVVKRSAGLTALLKKFARKTAGKLLNKMPKGVTEGVRGVVEKYDWKKSVAFGKTYVPGIFINDSKRFNGPIEDSKIDAIVDTICNRFNEMKAENRLNMVAVPYRRKFDKGRYTDYLPDIKLENSEGVFFDENGQTLFWKNKNYGPIPKDLSKVDHAAFTGDKSENPICVMTKSTAAYISPEDTNDLTLIYKLIDRIL